MQIYDYGRTEDGTFYYAMEYLRGLNLADLVERYGPMTPERVICLMIQACAGAPGAARGRDDPPRHQAGEHLRRATRGAV